MPRPSVGRIGQPRIGRAFAALVVAAAIFPGAAQERTALGQSPPGQQPPSLRIRVHGTAEVHAVAGADHGRLTVRGELIDDAGTAIPAAPILVSATAEGSRAPIRLGPFTPCDGTYGRGVRTASGEELVLETDDRGGFCATGPAPAERVALKIRFRGSKLHDGVESDTKISDDTERLQRALLRFEPPPETLDLDRDTLTVSAGLRVERNELFRGSAAGSAQRANLQLVLEDERHSVVAEAVTGGDGRARFEVKTSKLDRPGAGELWVRFAGNAVLAKAEDSHPVVRRAEAHLALAAPVGRADPEDGVPIEVLVTTARGPVEGGIVEVRRVRPGAGGSVQPESLGAGSVDRQGRTRIVATFAAPNTGKVPLSLRYVPAAPWYRPGPDLRVEVEIAGPSILRQLLLAAIVLGAGLWVAWGWRRSPRPPELPGVEGITGPPSGKAGVQVIASPADLAGWRGVVADAHDGSPIAGATLTIVAPSFSGDGTVVRVTTDERGAFAIDAPYKHDARLVVSSTEHATHEQPLPPPSVLRVALVTRRRALLERLVRWARQRGAPYDGAPEPTPGHVRRAGARQGANEIEAWAGRVEQVAYGPDRVDEAVDREIRTAEPGAVR